MDKNVRRKVHKATELAWRKARDAAACLEEIDLLLANEESSPLALKVLKAAGDLCSAIYAMRLYLATGKLPDKLPGSAAIAESQSAFIKNIMLELKVEGSSGILPEIRKMKAKLESGYVPQSVVCYHARPEDAALCESETPGPFLTMRVDLVTCKLCHALYEAARHQQRHDDVREILDDCMMAVGAERREELVPKVRALNAKLESSYIPQHVAQRLLTVLQGAGLGNAGRGNTISDMVDEAIDDRAVFAALRHAVAELLNQPAFKPIVTNPQDTEHSISEADAYGLLTALDKVNKAFVAFKPDFGPIKYLKEIMVELGVETAPEIIGKIREMKTALQLLRKVRDLTILKAQEVAICNPGTPLRVALEEAESC